MLHLKTYSKWSFWPTSRWARGIVFALLALLFLGLFAYALEQGSSRQLVRLLVQQEFPFEAVVMEGIPGYSASERPRLEQVRNQGVSLGTFLLTGVNMSDARTFFLSYFTPPPGGPAWIGWAYNPNDPEFEGFNSGPSLEPIPQDQANNPAPQNQTPTPQPNLGKAEALVGIYHTHNAESYTGDGGPERQEGENGDVVTVGATLKNALDKKGIPTLHSLEIHDAVDFNHAYSKSVVTATQLLQDNPSLKLLIDLHRDGLPPNVSKATTTIKGKEVGKIMIVIGQKNPHWKKNLEISEELISLAEDKYPGLFDTQIRYASDARYNEHLADGALLFEIGSQLNTLEEADGAAEALADVLTDWIKAH
ncbi:stage II sporulation protein P [Desulfitobacterium metallireducens]|uniref:Stage II sporulation protein P n=1 Tax=Desulfitobacterium metallireducens DSM 15288 TaxID=871968 RepID=W0EF99_9FIRM|nr:stage II sporulation protein P [Desulfitobacterium metallireducens]AHF07879.1 stage II sporulation protein P [Desulfitobacterium metallireducens DSM 15288]